MLQNQKADLLPSLRPPSKSVTWTHPHDLMSTLIAWLVTVNAERWKWCCWEGWEVLSECSKAVAAMLEMFLLLARCPPGGGKWGGGSGERLFGFLATSFARSVSSRNAGFENLSQLQRDHVAGGNCWKEHCPCLRASVGIWCQDDSSWKTGVKNNQGTTLKCFAVFTHPTPLKSYDITLAQCAPIQRWQSSSTALRDTWHRPPTVKLGHRSADDAKCRFFQSRFGSTKPNILSQMLDEFLGRVCGDEAQVF